MAVPTSISCPHCAASFNIKSQAAFGKKVKCPKCETPFVIEKPAAAKPVSRKKKPSRPAPDQNIFEAEDDDSLFDDDFGGWEDDLSNGETISSSSARKKSKPASPKKKKKTRSFSLRDYGFTPFLTGVAIFLILANVITLFIHPGLTALAIFLGCLFAACCLFAGGIGLLIAAASESGTELLLCLIVPFYNVYFAISRFEYTKNSLGALATGLVVLFSCIGSIMFMSNGRTFLSPRRSSSFSSASSPDFSDDQSRETERRLNSLKPGGINSSPSDFSPTSSSRSSSRTGASVAGTSGDFDLSGVKPMPLSWPHGNSRGLGYYSQRPTDSVATVYEARRLRKPGQEEVAGGRMHFRVYLPPGLDPDSPVPCVLVPPAGSNLLTGMAIDPSDLIPNPEHEFYVKEGFAVVTFSLDGDLPNPEQASIFRLKDAHEQFKKSQAGLVNCLHAFLETQAVIPGIDKNNVFIAGHSSAGTLSLLFAEHYPQVKGCLAYAPSVDLKHNFAPHLAEIKPLLPDVEEFIRQSSPHEHIQKLKCPVFLFHAKNDPVTSFDDTQKFVSQLKQQGTEVEFAISQGTDHYQTMVNEGLPQGIAWIKKIVARPASSAADNKMAASQSKQTDGKMSSTGMASAPTSPQIDLTRHKATYKIIEFDKFHTNAMKNGPGIWIKSLQDNVQRTLLDIIPGFSRGTVIIDKSEMTVSFEFVGEIPPDFASQYAEHFWSKSVKLDTKPLSVVEAKNDPNSAVMNANYLTFRIITLNRLRFHPNTSPKLVEASLRQIPSYLPDSIRINYETKWVYVRFRGLEDKEQFIYPVDKALGDAGILVTHDQQTLPSEELSKLNSPVDGKTTDMNQSQESIAPQADNTKQKYIIHYGVYGGDNVTDSARRFLKGFVWVDQESVHFNPDKKEITFENRSAVDQGALDRALKRNKFYQVEITREAVLESPAEKTSDKAGAGTE